MNNTTNSYISSGPTEKLYFQTVSTVCGVVSMIVFLCSLVLSTGALWALWKTKQLKSPVYRMVAYMLFDEMLVRIFGSPLVVTSLLAGRWLYGDFGCIFYAFWMTWLGVTATSLFTCVAVERYLIICCRDTTHRVTTKVVDILALMCYLHGLIWASLPLIGVNRYVYEPSRISCTPSWSRDNAGYILALFTVCFLVPVTVSAFSYSAIFYSVRKSRLRLATTQNSSAVDSGVALMLVVTMAAFLFAWTPYSVIGLYNTLGFSEEIHIAKEWTLIPLIAAKSAGLWNPLVFNLRNRKVRAALATCIYSRLKCRHRSEILPETEVPVYSNNSHKDCNMRNDSVVAMGNRTPVIKLHPREVTVSTDLLTTSKCRVNNKHSSTQPEMDSVSEL